MSDCKWNPAKHDGEACPTHGSGGNKNSKEIQAKKDYERYKKDPIVADKEKWGADRLGRVREIEYMEDETRNEIAKAKAAKSAGGQNEKLNEDFDSTDENAEEFGGFDDDLSSMLMTDEDDSPKVTKGSKVDALVKDYMDQNWDKIDKNGSLGELAYKISGQIGKPYPQVLDSVSKEVAARNEHPTSAEKPKVSDQTKSKIKDQIKGNGISKNQIGMLRNILSENPEINQLSNEELVNLLEELTE